MERGEYLDGCWHVLALCAGPTNIDVVIKAAPHVDQVTVRLVGGIEDIALISGRLHNLRVLQLTGGLFCLFLGEACIDISESAFKRIGEWIGHLQSPQVAA